MAKDNLRKAAEGMFIEQGMTAKAIAELIDVTEKTVGRWREEGKWDARRDENLAAPHKIREVLLQEMKNISQGKASQVDADSLSKIARVMETISDKINPQIVISVLKGFDNWMAEQEPKMAVTFLEWHKQYLQHVIAQHG